MISRSRTGDGSGVRVFLTERTPNDDEWQARAKAFGNRQAARFSNSQVGCIHQFGDLLNVVIDRNIRDAAISTVFAHLISIFFVASGQENEMHIIERGKVLR